MARYKKGEWSPKYQEILILTQKGLTNKEIAAKVGMYPTTICKIVNRMNFRARENKLMEKVTERITKTFEAEAERAARRIIRISKVGKPQDRIKFDASKEILYQVGAKPKEVIETIRRDYTPEEIESANKIAQETAEIVERLRGTHSRFILPNQGCSETMPEEDKRLEVDE